MSLFSQTEIDSGSKTTVPGAAARPPEFAATRWSLVVRARGETPEAQAALSELCECYYKPVLGFLRREGRTEEEAREFAQEFFARILGSRGFEGADQARGRFRSYVLGALKHFLADARQKAHRQKRGGGIAPTSLEEQIENADGESDGIQVADFSAVSPDANFDREWALEVMKRALAALEIEMTARRKGEHFLVLRPWLAGEGADSSQAAAAQKLRMSESAVKVAVHRLRKRFGELVKIEIAHTLRDPAQADEELAHLIAALG